MFHYVVVVRHLTAEELAERKRRWMLFFWLIFVGFFVMVVNLVFDAYKEIAFPDWFKSLVWVTVPAFLSWGVVRYWRVLLGTLVAVSFVMWVFKLVVALWQSTGG
jgi:hypothetical protein